jgi:hypothetical protein
MMLQEVKGVWHKQFGWVPEFEVFAGSSVSLPGNDIRLIEPSV